MPTFAESIDVPAPPEAVFALSQDYARRLDWDPFLRSAEFLGGATAPAVGVEVQCVSRSGLTMDAAYTTYDAPTTAAVSMVAGPWFLSHFAATWLFHPHGPSGTHVIFRYRVRTAPSRLRLVMEPFVIWGIRRQLRRRLRGLRDYFAAQARDVAVAPPAPAPPLGHDPFAEARRTRRRGV